jgi:integrase
MILPISVEFPFSQKVDNIFSPYLTAADLRHTFATVALQNRVDIKTLSGILGHYSAGFTLDTYTHVTSRIQQEAADKMGEFMSGAIG